MFNDDDVLVCYHANCLDGFTAAWVVYKKYPKAEFRPTFHDSPPTDVEGKHVIMVDIAFSKIILQDINKRAKSLTVIDHHITAKKEIGEEDFFIFDNFKSGAGLKWDC